MLLLAVAVFSVPSARADGPAHHQTRMSIALPGQTLYHVLTPLKRQDSFQITFNTTY